MTSINIGPEIIKMEELPVLLPRVTLFPELEYFSVKAAVRRPVLEAQRKVPVITFRTEVVETRGLGELNVPQIKAERKTIEQNTTRHSSTASFVANPVLRLETGIDWESSRFECKECFATFYNINNYNNHEMLHRDVVVVAHGEDHCLKWDGYSNSRGFCKNKMADSVPETVCRELVKLILDNVISFSKK